MPGPLVITSIHASSSYMADYIASYTCFLQILWTILNFVEATCKAEQVNKYMQELKPRLLYGCISIASTVSSAMLITAMNKVKPAGIQYIIPVDG